LVEQIVPKASRIGGSRKNRRAGRRHHQAVAGGAIAYAWLVAIDMDQCWATAMVVGGSQMPVPINKA
jgi:hypothetical protein